MIDGNPLGRPVGELVANCTLLYADVEPLDRAKAAVADGYRKLEFWWPFDATVPADRDVDRFIDSVESSGARAVAMNFTLGGPSAGGRGIASHPARSAEFAEHAEVVAGIVGRLGITLCNVPYGVRLRGIAAADDQRHAAVQNLTLASERLAVVHAIPMLEPISGADDYPITTAAQAVDVIERVEACTGRVGAVGLLADLYHLAANGEDVEAVLRRYLHRIVHVQVADHPGRHEPGSGRLDIARYVTLMDDWGYRGDIAMEYIPSSPCSRLSVLTHQKQSEERA